MNAKIANIREKLLFLCLWIVDCGLIILVVIGRSSRDNSQLAVPVQLFWSGESDRRYCVASWM
jgi:hypothetical protein